MSTHTLGDVFAMLDLQPHERDVFGQVLDKYPQVKDFRNATVIVREPNAKCYGRTVQVPINDPAPFRILPFEITRTKAIITAPPANVNGSGWQGTIRIGQSSDVLTDGFTLYPGNSITIEAADDVYVTTQGGAAAVGSYSLPISVWIELAPATSKA